MADWLSDQYMSWSGTDRHGHMTREIITPQDLINYTWDMAEDFSESYDLQWFQLFYADKKSPCINWRLIADRIQQEKDDHWLAVAFQL